MDGRIIMFTLEDRVQVAKWMGLNAMVIDGVCKLCYAPLRGYSTIYQPIIDNVQFKDLLKKVISVGDCKLFYDDAVNEYFIYTWGDKSPPLAHNESLEFTTFMAALELSNE